MRTDTGDDVDMNSPSDSAGRTSSSKEQCWLFVKSCDHVADNVIGEYQCGITFQTVWQLQKTLLYSLQYIIAQLDRNAKMVNY